jgi:hypothetical protein
MFFPFRLSCGRFLRAIKKELKDLSSTDEMGAPWPQELQLSRVDWRKAQEWLQNTEQHILPTKDGKKIFVPRSASVESHFSTQVQVFLPSRPPHTNSILDVFCCSL